MVTKELARRFCVFYNIADPGQMVNVFPDGSIGVGPENGRAWCSVMKGNQIESTEEAARLLESAKKEAIARLNAL